MILKFTKLFSILFLFAACTKTAPQTKVIPETITLLSTPAERDSIIKEHLSSAYEKGLYSRAFQEELDKGLAKDSTIAYLWQQKAMPLYKQGKYEAGSDFLDKAVKYKPEEYLEYRAFMKCIFSKRYKSAIEDFEACKAKYGNSIVMDHSYDFYIGISQLQLNLFEEAEQTFEKDLAHQIKTYGEGFVHHLDLFYLGISKYENEKYEEGIVAFDKALKLYPEFADAQYYKAMCIGRLGNEEEALELIEVAAKNGQAGYTINEDNASYERYPYQKRWQK